MTARFAICATDEVAAKTVKGLIEVNGGPESLPDFIVALMPKLVGDLPFLHTAKTLEITLLRVDTPCPPAPSTEPETQPVCSPPPN